MIQRISTAKSLRGTFKVPGDKSITHRAFMISALADGDCEIEGFLDAADTRSTLSCLRSLGIEQVQGGSRLVIRGKGLRGFTPAPGTLQAGNSGTTMRLLTGILAGQPFISRIAGDESLNNRPMKRIIDPLTQMGASIKASPRFTAPLTISGVQPLRPIEHNLPIASAQVKSAILFAGLFADGVTIVNESHPTRDHTERMLGLEVKQRPEGRVISVDGKKAIQPRRFFVPGDFSSAVFLVAAALLVPDSQVRLCGVGLNPTRTRAFDILQSLGAEIECQNERVESGEPTGDIVVRSSELRGSITVQEAFSAEVIDEIPILAITAALNDVAFEARGSAELRHKESDRIHAIAANLRKLGMEVNEFEDGFSFHGKKHLRGAEFDSYGDHRIAMAFGVAGLALQGETRIRGADCVAISFPAFWQTLQSVQH